MIRPVNTSDVNAITEIYNHYVQHSIATFDEILVEPAEMERKIKMTISKDYPWLVYEDHQKVLGYAYASEWNGRRAYRYSAESSIYLSAKITGKGVGSQLYEALLKQLRAKKVHAVIGGISLPNKESVALHEKFKYQKVAHYKEVGFKFGKWIDVGYWQLLMKY